MGNYDDIKNHERYRLKKHTPMSMWSRAAQFSPFAALTGFDEDIDETARLTDEFHELTEEELDRNNAVLCEMMERESENPKVHIIYFKPDERKSGGSYKKYIGNLRFFDEESMILNFTDGSRIPVKQIVRAEIVE
ncbi:MAG: hypothetical protein ACLU4K_06620 [Oscillospiraceae bacterium]